VTQTISVFNFFGLLHYPRYQGHHFSMYLEYLENFKQVREVVLSADLIAEELKVFSKDFTK
ncbi:uncharacterized protein METZ01_LOCUS467451, partial [marine metagenome]